MPFWEADASVTSGAHILTLSVGDESEGDQPSVEVVLEGKEDEGRYKLLY